ncbi:MAG: peptidase M23 [Cytophagales bacterium]|nr:MAG: peptidase M23 [Cytophagales bacterium]
MNLRFPYIIKCSLVIYIILFLIGSVNTQLWAQSKKNQLEKEKEENLKKISETNRILEETRTKKSATVGQLTAINHQINARNSLINAIASEIEEMDKAIAENESIMLSMETDVNTLKKEYANMIYVAYKSNNMYDHLTFLFSSKTFNQLYNRLQYFKQYSDSRKNQVQLINKVTNYLSEQKNKISLQRAEKNQLLESKTNETKALDELKNQQNKLVAELSNKEKELKTELEENKKSVKKLEKLITDLIASERERAMKEIASVSRSKKTKKGSLKENITNVDKVEATPEVVEMSNSFAGNQNRMLWPVQHGSISHHFGKQPHPVLKGVFVENLGVDIQTLKNEQVRNVFEGKVITVASVPGMNNVVMVQHGEYFTVYAKLKTVNVITGQDVKPRDIIGEVYTDKNDVSELQFQIWRNNEKQDPEIWLKKR